MKLPAVLPLFPVKAGDEERSGEAGGHSLPVQRGTLIKQAVPKDTLRGQK